MQYRMSERELSHPEPDKHNRQNLRTAPPSPERANTRLLTTYQTISRKRRRPSSPWVSPPLSRRKMMYPDTTVKQYPKSQEKFSSAYTLCIVYELKIVSEQVKKSWWQSRWKALVTTLLSMMFILSEATSTAFKNIKNQSRGIIAIARQHYPASSVSPLSIWMRHYALVKTFDEVVVQGLHSEMLNPACQKLSNVEA